MKPEAPLARLAPLGGGARARRLNEREASGAPGPSGSYDTSEAIAECRAGRRDTRGEEPEGGIGMAISIKQLLYGLAMCAVGGCTPTAPQGYATHQEANSSHAGQAGTAQAAVQAYFDALNRGDVDGAVAAYTADGYVALQGAEDVQGTAALRTLYEGTFKAVRFNATHILNEVRAYGDEAFVRTTTNASLTVVANERVIPDRYREFFVLKKVGGQWKIDRYMNNKPTP